METPTLSLTLSAVVALLAKVTAVLALAALAAVLLRRFAASAAAHHALWTAALASALLLAVLAVAPVTPQWPVVPVPAALAPAAPEAPVAMGVETLQRPLAASAPAVPAARSVEPAIGLATKDAESAKGLPGRTPTPEQAQTAQAVSPRAVGGGQERLPAPPASPFPVLPVLLGVWAAGSALVLGRHLMNALRLRRAVRGCRLVASGPMTERLRALQQHLGIRRPVTLLESPDDAMEVPMTWGVVYPVVLVPESARGWTAERLDAVLQHELAHVKRCDALTQWVAHGACAVYWFHPLAWPAARQMRAERERACDDFVLHAGVPASAYAKDLLEIVSAFRTPAVAEQYPAALAMARRSQFEGRLMALLDAKNKRTSLSAAQVAALVVLMAGLTVPLAALAARSGDYQAAVKQAEEQGPSADANPPRDNAAPPQPDARSPRTDAASPVTTAAQAGEGSGVGFAYTTSSSSSGSAQGTGVGFGYGTSASDAAAAQSSNRSSSSYNTDLGYKQLRAAGIPDSARRLVEPDLLTGCVRDKSENSSSMSHSDGKVTRRTVSWRGADCSVDMRSEGKFTFNPDFTGIQSIEPGGYVNISADIKDQITKLAIRPGSGGLEYKFSRNGQETPFADGGTAFLARFMITLDRVSAAGIDVRFPKLLREGGPNRVLAEVEVMASDHPRSRYMQQLAESVELNNADLQNVLALTRHLSSDYEKAKVLIAVARKYDLKDPGVRDAFLQVTLAMGSDYEHARSMLAFFEKGGSTPAQAKAILQSVTKMRSDYERTRVLTKLADVHRFDAEDRMSYVRAATAMSSDYEKNRALRAFIKTQVTDDATALAVIGASEKMSSDYERSNLLLALAQKRPVEGQVREAYIEAARKMSSDYERGRAMRGIGTGPAKAGSML